MRKLITETSTQKLYWDEKNEIVWSELYNSVQTIEDAIENIEAQEKVRDFLNREKTRVLIELGALTKISKDARVYFANERTAAVQRATALLTDSRMTVLIANFFMGLNKPLSPTQMFNQTDDAVQWLHTFSKD